MCVSVLKFSTLFLFIRCFSYLALSLARPSSLPSVSIGPAFVWKLEVAEALFFRLARLLAELEIAAS